MPPLEALLRAAGRAATGWTVTAVLSLTASLAMADHGGIPLPQKGGLDWTSWLLVAGAVAAVGLAAWAFFAPDRGEPRPGSAPREGSKPESPAR